MARVSSAAGSAQCAHWFGLVLGKDARNRKLGHCFPWMASASLRQRSNCFIKHQEVEQNAKNDPDSPVE